MKLIPTICHYHMFQALNPLLNGPSIIFIKHMDDIWLVQYDSSKLQEGFQMPQTIISENAWKQFVSSHIIFFFENKWQLIILQNLVKAYEFISGYLERCNNR